MVYSCLLFSPPETGTVFRAIPAAEFSGAGEKKPRSGKALQRRQSQEELVNRMKPESDFQKVVNRSRDNPFFEGPDEDDQDYDSGSADGDEGDDEEGAQDPREKKSLKKGIFSDREACIAANRRYCN